MELECDLSTIKNEELLRKMWQHSEDTNRKKEIRSQLFKLRESRLRDLYQGDIMSDNTIAGFGKDPLTASHGDALADQSFQSLKSKEIRDSMSPTEMKFQSMALNHPTTTGWNVQSSKEISPDGRGFRTESVATTDGVENVNGGTAEFKGRNEQRSSAHHQGDDKNFVKKAMESSNSHLQEKVVLGDENSGRTEVRSSSTRSTSSSQVFQSSSNVEYDDRAPIAQHPHHQPYLMDHPHRHPQQQQQEEQRIQEEHRLQEQQFRQQHQQHVNQQQERRTSEQLSTTRQNTEQNVQTQETHEQNKRYVDMDKASPEYQQHVQFLMQQPGEVISQNVEYPKPNVKMITTVKRLPDGTIVRNKRYETEETTPTPHPSTRQTSTSPNQTNPRRDSQPQTKNYQPDLTPSGRNPTRRPTEDLVDNSRDTTRYTQDTHSDDVETKFSSVKKSSRKFSTESTSETIQESSHPETSRIRSVTSDFSTHGFPSVKSTKPTQEYPSDRPQGGSRPTQGYPSQPSDAVIPHFTDDAQNITERRIPTKDGELIIVSSEKQRNYKHQTNSERVVETEHNVRDDQDFSTHGFPSVREPLSQPKNFPEQRQMQPTGFPMDKTSPGTRIITTTTTSPNDDAVVVSSQKSHTVKNSSNTERIIEHEVVRDDQGFPRIQPTTDHNIYNYTVTTPGDQYPGSDFPGSTRKSPPSNDYSTQGFPSVRSPAKNTPYDQGFPSTRDGNKPNGVGEQPRVAPTKTQPRATSPNKFRAPNTTRDTTERVIRKEKEVDSAHRAFAASLRSSSPLESHTTDSHGRHTPRSSVSSTKTFRRDMREGSHDSAPSETSRFSNTTVTRQTPPRTVGGKTTVTRVVTTKTSPGSNENINVTSPRATKSPSPGKTVTTTTTTKTITTKTPTSPTKEVPKSTDNQPTRNTSTTNKSDSIFPPINEPLTITKINFSDNHKQRQNNSQRENPLLSPGIIEEPCLKKSFYLLGPSDHPTKTKTQTKPYKNSVKFEKSPLKQLSSPQSSPAPSSRTSTLSYKNSKSLMADDNDDDTDTDQPEKFNTTHPATSSSPLSPSRSRTPKQPSNDERRTVHRETTFEKPEKLPQDRKPSYEQTNIEWVVVDDVDIVKDDDDDDVDEDYEDVDFGLNIKRTTNKLITHEKEVPLVPRRGPKTTTDKPTSNRPSYNINSPETVKPQGSPKDKSPSKTGPQSRPQKPLTESKTPLPSKSQPKTPNVKNQPKLISKSPNKEVLPLTTPNQRKPQAKTVIEKTEEIIKEKTTKVINDKKVPLKETPKRRDISPEYKPNRGATPVNRKPKETETYQKRLPERESPNRRSMSPENTPKQRIIEEQTISTKETTQKLYPEQIYPEETDEDETTHEFVTKPNYPIKETPQKGPKSLNKVTPLTTKSPISQAPTPNQRKPKPNMPVDDLSFRKTLRTTEIFTTEMIDDEEFPEEDIYNKASRPKAQPKEPTSDFENPSEPEEDYETFTKTREHVIKSSQNRIKSETNVQELVPQKGPKTVPTYPKQNLPKVQPKQPTSDFENPSEPEEDEETFTETSEFVIKSSQNRIVSEKNVQDLRPQKAPKTGPKYPNEDQTIRKPISTTLNDEEFPDEESPNKKVSRPERKPKNDRKIPGETNDNETFTAPSEFVVKSTQKQPKGPKYPNKEVPEVPLKKDISPSRTPKKSDPKPSSADQSLKKTLKTTAILKETTTKTVEDKETPEKNKPHKPQQPKERYHSPEQFTESEDDETCTETSEIFIKSSQNRVITEKQVKESTENYVTEPIFPDKKVPDSKKPQKGPRYPNKDNELPTYDQTFKNSLRTTETLKETTTKTIEDEEIAEEETPRKKGLKPKSIPQPETDEDDTLNETSEYEVTISQKYVSLEDVESEEEPNKKAPKPLKEDTPTYGATPLQPFEDETPKYGPVSKEPIQKAPKPTKAPRESPKYPSEKDTPTYGTTPLQPFDDETPKYGSVCKEPKEKKPEHDKPQFTTTYEETIETIQKQNYPQNKEKFPETPKLIQTTTETMDQETLEPNNEKPIKPKTTTSYKETTTVAEEENWLPKAKPKTSSNINETFIETERVRTETPDGAFITKTTECSEPLSPTFKKKGAGRRDTFEDRCRQILGMETYGDTPGTFKNQPIHETKETTEEVKKETTNQKEEFENTTVFQVKIEDCDDDDDDDDEPITINSVKLHKQIHTTEQKRNEPFREEPSEPKEPKKSPLKEEPKRKPSQPLEPKEKPLEESKKTPSQPFGNRGKPLEEPKKKPIQPSGPKRKSLTKDDTDLERITDTTVITKTPRNLSPESKRKPTRDAETIHTITETTVYKKSPKIKPLDTDTDDVSDQETYISSSHITDNLEQIEVVNNRNKISEMKITRSVSPNKKTSPLRSESPTKETKNLGSPKRKPSRETVEPKSIKTLPKKQAPKPDTESTTTTTIKDRLRSSTRKTKSPSKHDQVDGSESSPEPSPTRISERRRSSNISVNTEIIIEHTEVATPEKSKKSPGPKRPHDSVVRDIIDSTVLPDKLTRKMLVTERKESAPVHRVTHKDKDSKMSRSTSENLIKVKKPESNNLSPKTTPKSTDHRRPNKCFATKSINLTPTDRLVNSEDMENVIIDIQHAKSSREPSPDKIVPTPVPAHLDTGKPRYPDVVQEPEDEQPRRKPQVKNIPIFEEENNSYVGFHISEVNIEKSRKTTMDSLDYDHEILNNPLIEAPPSLDYPSLEKPSDDECLLTVHEKVSKFQNIAEEVKKPKPSSPFNREFDESTKVPVDDECLLTIDEKVDKFLKTAENVTNTPTTPAVRVEKIPYFDEDDEEFERNERIFSSIKLAPTVPQKSPDLVRNISRNISRQSEAEPCEDTHHNVVDDYTHVTATTNEDFVECLVNNKKTTKECVMTHQQPSAEKYHQIPYKRNNDRDDDDEEDDDEELIPHTATHTTILEERRQKDILTRPSVFDNKSNNKKPNAVNTTTATTTTTTTKTPLKSTTTTRTTTKSPVKDSEKLRPDIKSRTKPATTAEPKHSTEQQHIKTSAYTSKRRQSPQRNTTHTDTDTDYELRARSGSNNVETGVGIISKQTKVYKNNYTTIGTSTSTSNNSTTDNFKKSTQLVNTKPEKHIPVRLIPAKNLDENDLNTDEMIINIETTTTTNTSSSSTNINDSSTVVNGKINKEPNKLNSTTPHSTLKQKQATPQHSSTTNSSPKEHVTTKLIERSTLKHNLDTTSKITANVETPETIEPVLEPTKRAPFTPKSTKITTMDTVAARRHIFENNQGGAVTPTKRTPSASPLPGRRPSYMDHTKSSLEHTRRDSLEINKTHYSRKPSQTDDDVASVDRHSLVKFNVPRNKLSPEVTTTEVTTTEDINIEEIFDLVILESMLETVTSYELRRRIRAQIRLIKKNQKNEVITTEVTTRTTTSKPNREETDNSIRKTKPLHTTDRSLSPIGKTTKQFLTKESESHSFTRNQNIRKEQNEYRQQSPTRPKSSPSSSPDRYDHGDSDFKRDRSPDTKTKPLRSYERSHSPQEKPVCARNVAHNRPRDHDDDEDFELIPHTAKHTTIIEERRQKDILSRPSVFDNKKPNERSRSPQEKPVCLRNVTHNRSHSPEMKETVREEYGSRSTTKKQYYYNDEEIKEIKQETRKHSTGSPTRKSPSPHTSPERRDSSPESKKPLKTTQRSRSPPGKPASPSRLYSRSPDTKTSSSLRKTSTTEQTLKSSSTKQQDKRVPIKTKPEVNASAPLWADRRNLLKTPGSTTPKKPATSTLESRSGFTKTIKSTSSQRMTSTNKSSFIEDDCITSSYGIGPTDENGLPLFGIRALKKKKPTTEPCETTEEVTGYIVEEKSYSDNKTKPIVERKELIYSTNPEELEKIKEQVKGTSTLKSLKDADIKEYRQTALISKANPKATPALRSSPEDDFLDSTTKYVRRGSVKEMSEKFIHRESSSSITEKSSYPKAGLILRTNSRKNSRDNETDGENYDSYKTTRVQHTGALADSDDAEHEYEVEEIGSRHSGRLITESESEGESIKTQREFKKVTSSKSSSTRSFLNTQGEEKMITNVSDCLERMRNADNVIEDGDTTEDQEARALLNKFLGASIIMKGVETSIAPASNRQSKIVTTTTTNNKRGDINRSPQQEVKTTRITKTIKSGSSSSPVIQTTCDIEEIWDEEILKELLEQAKTYEERRKIRSRLRELMADREEKNNSQAGEKEVKPSTEVAKVQVEEEEESSASEYEEIIEEVTDYSESEAESDDKNTINKAAAATTTATKVTDEKEKSNEAKEELSVEESPKKPDSTDSKKSDTSSSSSDEETVKEETVANNDKDKLKEVDTKTETKNDKVEEEEVKVESKQESVDKTDSSEKGESIKPQGGISQQQKQQSTNSQKLKSVQSSSGSSSKTTTAGIKAKTSSDTSSMHAPTYKKLSSAAPKTSPNPIVTVQTAGRTDSTSVSNKATLNSSSGSHKSSSVVSSNTVVVVGNNSPRQVDRLGVPQKEDSGTESGEDLRLIAAGLRDQLQIQSDSNIIEDVTCALSRLESSLKEGKDIAVDLEKRKALLALVARLQAGLTSPEKLAQIAAAMSELDGNEGLYGESSSPEADAHRSNRSRFAKRRSRIDRHTVGVSREELADARRYMEDMIMMGNISQSTTPEANNPNNTSPPQWYPIEKNASVGAILTPPSPSVLQRPKQFVPEDTSPTMSNNKLTVNNSNKRRPISGEFSVSFEPQVSYKQEEVSQMTAASSRDLSQSDKQTSPNDDSSKFARFSNKKHLMKRANTIDIAKTQKYNSEFDTDSDAEDKGPYLGLKRTVQVSVKKRAANVVPAFEPKTENDRKFLAFINKQSDKPGLGWTSSRSVSNWSNKFGSIKNTFEGGLVSKPPQVPHHVAASSTKPPHHSYKLFNQPVPNNSAAPFITTNQQIAQRLKQEAERQTEERRRKLEREHLEYERRERDQLERQRQQKERQERERLEREYFERQRREQDQIAAAQHAAIRREQEQLAKAQQQQQQAANVNVPKPMPINDFKHAPQSVFRPIDNVDTPAKPIYKPIPQLPMHSNNWQSLTSGHRGLSSNNLTPTSPNNYGRPDNSFITSPTPSSRSPIGLPWASKPTVDSSSFKTKANRFEERSKYDNISSGGPFLQRHNSLRSANGNAQQIEEFRKRPSLPNTCDPYSVNQIPQTQYQDPLAYLPPPQNISFTYNDLKPNRKNYQSYPCLPTAVSNNANEPHFERSREDSLTDPNSVPLVLSANNPSYCPAPQQQNLNQPPTPRQFDIVSPLDSAPTSPSVMLQTDCTDDDIDSDNLLEYHAVSRVMRKPQSQTAVTVGRRTGHASDDELFGKNSRAARNLLSTMKNIGNPIADRPQKLQAQKRPEQVTSPTQCLSPDGRSYQAPLVEPLFPEVTNFEPNRKPLYAGPQARPTYTPKHEVPRQNNMYKSLDSLNRPQTTNQSGYSAPMQPFDSLNRPQTTNQSGYTAPIQPLDSFNRPQTTNQTAYMAPMQPLPQAAPSLKPYVSETQTSYVVTYPTEETDDEDFSRHSQKKMLPPSSLDLRRQRNISENSTGSSTTASISYNHNLPSPNTSWTANPIMSDDYNNYQKLADQNQSTPRSQPQANVRSLNQSLAEQSYTYQPQSTMLTQNQMAAPQQQTAATQQQQQQPLRQMPTDYMRTSSYEAQAQRPLPTMTSPQYPSAQMQQPPIQKMGPTQPPYETPIAQIQLPTMPAQQLPMAPMQSPSILQHIPTSPLYEIQQQELPNHAPIQKPYEVLPERQLPTMTAQLPTAKAQQSPNPTSPAQKPQQQQKTTKIQTVPHPKKTPASGYEAQPQRQLQTNSASQQTQRVSTQKQTSKTNYESQTQRQTTTMTSQQPQPQQKQQPLGSQKPPITQKPIDYQIKNTQQIKQVSQTTTTQEKNINRKSLASMRKSISEDHTNVREQIVINPQNSNISQEMISKLDQQRERVNNEIRRKSMGNALEHQMEQQARFETEHTELYTSSAPLDTPDIVKSSLPKDENQPILKKFGPPQRHHYIPNAYQSPGTNVAQSTTVHTKNMEVSSNKTTIKTSQQQMLSITRPSVVETPATPQPDDDYIPRNIVFNNVHAFTSMSRRQDEDTYLTQEQPQTRPNKLSKSDSWNQIIQLQNQNMPAPAPKFNQSPTNELRRTKSGHTLALPKMFEAAMAKADISEKQKTVAAYFSGQKSPTQQELMIEQHSTKKSVINRTKTSEKMSASRKSLGCNLPISPGGLTRSATMPHIANLNLLDESNVEDAFEQLMLDQNQQKSSSSTTEKTETKAKDGAVVTTTTKVTTRTVTGSAPKPVSPFAKFKQLDRQNSQQSAKSPTTPPTPGGATIASPSSGNQPIFKFTDPALNARAATVKDQLLQWCQMKTQEYENIEITNFSTSWNNGLAFCALIHHFLPDAFDYSQLTPKNRRKNFDLAFTVADEKAGIAPLLDVEDMVVMQRPDWKCVFVYVQSIYRRFRNCQ